MSLSASPRSSPRRWSLTGSSMFGLASGAPAGCARVASAVVFNFEVTPGPFTFNITVCDNGAPMLCRVASLSVSIDDDNEDPVSGLQL